MRRDFVSFALAAISIHAIFIALSYSPTILSSFSPIVDPVSIERMIMLFQFAPFLVVVISNKFSKSRGLLFLTFALSISTLFIVDDFGTGFYGAFVDYNSGIVPRMRTSAHLMAYRDTGKLVSLDFHGEYFFEFMLVYFLSEISSLNYVLTYFFIIRIIVISMWSLLFVWLSDMFSANTRRLWIFILAPSILLANQSYNYEMSFAPILLLLFYMITVRRHARGFVSISIFLAIATLLASFRETLLLGMVSFAIFCAATLSRVRTNISHNQIAVRYPFFVTISVLAFGRIFLLTSSEYFGGYANRLFALSESILAALRGDISLKEPVLSTVQMIQNPFDRIIAQTSILLAVSFLVAIAILSFRLMLKLDLGAPSLGVFLVFIIALSIPAGAYLAEKVTGSGPVHDFSSATVLARSLAPLSVVAIGLYVGHSKIFHQSSRRALIIFVIVYLSMTVIFAPFIFSRKETRSSYDMLETRGDMSEYTILGNSLYKFVVLRISSETEIDILSPATGVLQHYYYLPLQYITNRQVETAAMKINLESRIFDNSLFTVSADAKDPSMIFLNELMVTSYW